MSNVRQFPGTEEESAGKRIRKTIRRRRLTGFYRIALVLLVVIAVVIAYLIYEKTKVYETVNTVSSVQRVEIGSAKLMNFGGNILSYSKDGAGATDPNGKLLWNQTFDMQNPMASVCGGTAAFADYGGSTIYLQTAAGFSGTVTTDKPIRKITVSDKGYVAAVLEDTDVTWIYMYDINGTEIAYFRTTMEKSGYPVDLDISPSGELIAVSYYYVDIDTTRSSVAFHNFGDVGQNNIDNYVSGYNYSGTIVPVVRFLDDDTAFSLSTASFNIYSGAHKPVSIADIFLTDDVLSVYYGKEVIGIIYRNNSIENKYRLEIYGDKGKLLSTHEFDFDYAGVEFGNSNYVLYGDSSIYVSTFLGECKFEGNYSQPIKLVVPIGSDTRFVFVTENSIDTVEFK